MPNSALAGATELTERVSYFMCEGFKEVESLQWPRWPCVGVFLTLKGWKFSTVGECVQQ